MMYGFIVMLTMIAAVWGILEMIAPGRFIVTKDTFFAEEEYRKYKKKKRVAGIVVLAISVIVIVGNGMLYAIETEEMEQTNRKIAGEYTEAVMNAIFKGESSAYAELIGADVVEVQNHIYDVQRDAFLENLRTAGYTATDEEAEAYCNLGIKIYTLAKYEVQDAVKVSEGYYVVPVEVEPADVWYKFYLGLDGIYADELEKNTDEDDLFPITLAFLQKCYDENSYGPPFMMEIHVTKTEDGVMDIPSEDYGMMKTLTYKGN